MAGKNLVIIIGRLGQDPEVKYFQDGSAAANFSVATSQEWKDKNTGEKKEKTEWHRIVAFRKLAALSGKYLSKGKQVYIEGRLQTRSWEKEGQTHYATEIVANEIQFLGGKTDGQQPRQQSPAPDNYGPIGGGYDDDDIPF